MPSSMSFDQVSLNALCAAAEKFILIRACLLQDRVAAPAGGAPNQPTADGVITGHSPSGPGALKLKERATKPQYRALTARSRASSRLRARDAFAPVTLARLQQETDVGLFIIILAARSRSDRSEQCAPVCLAVAISCGA